MSKPDIKGLEKLAAHLQQVKRSEFSMESWIETTPCGTTGCIAGHAAMVFPRRFIREKVWDQDDAQGYIVKHRQSGIGGSMGFARVFKITLADAQDLTVSDRSIGFVTPKQAAKAVTQLVAKLKREMVGEK